MGVNHTPIFNVFQYIICIVNKQRRFTFMSLLRRYTTSNLSSLFDDIWNSSPVDYYYRRDHWVPVNETTGRMEVELAGFTREQIEVYTENNMVVVSAKGGNSRAYYKTWSLGDYERVNKVKFENGLLSIEIEKVVPDEKKRQVHRIE